MAIPASTFCGELLEVGDTVYLAEGVNPALISSPFKVKKASVIRLFGKPSCRERRSEVVLWDDLNQEPPSNDGLLVIRARHDLFTADEVVDIMRTDDTAPHPVQPCFVDKAVSDLSTNRQLAIALACASLMRALPETVPH